MDVDKLETIPTYLSNLSNLVDSDVVEKADYNAKMKDIKEKTANHDKLITTDHSNKFTKQNFAHRLKQSNLTTNGDVISYKKTIKN